MSYKKNSGIPRSVVLLAVFIVGGLLLSGCSSIEERKARVEGTVNDITATASGTYHSAAREVEKAIIIGTFLYETVQSTVQEFDERIDKVQQGVEKIQEGKGLIREGVGN
jgi:uncharacterized protein YceK